MSAPESSEGPSEERPTRKRTRRFIGCGIALSATAAIVALLVAGVDKVREDVERSGDAQVQIAIALHHYHSGHGRFPPAAVHGADGKPLYSWRVEILPYIEEEQLYKQFALDEPWDSPHNIKLLPRMPRTYAAPGRKALKMPPYRTVCHVFVGKGAAFEGRQGLNMETDFPDGTTNTILLVDTGKPVPWTKPEDLEYDPDGPLPDLQGIFDDGFWACMVDGPNIRRWIKKGTSEATLRALITRNGGDRPGPDWP